MAATEAKLPVAPGPARSALRWSADNLLAVACEHSVIIIVRAPLRTARTLSAAHPSNAHACAAPLR
jgi:hypothetical protein